MNTPATQAPLLESLEARTLFAAAPLLARGDGELMAAFTEISAQRDIDSSRSLVGRYRGTATIPPLVAPYRINLNIRQHTIGGQVSGTIAAPGLGTAPFTTQVTLTGRNRFSMSIDQAGISAQLNGTKTAKGLKGTLTATAEQLPVPLAGRFSLTRIKG